MTLHTPKLVTLDFETYYDTEYSLSKMTTEQYIRDPRFEIIGVSYKIGDAAAKWVSLTSLEDYAKHLAPLKDHFVICHHTAFDGAILGWRLGIHPKFLFDTLSMSRPENQMTVGGSLKALADKYTVGQKGTEVIRALGKHRSDFTADELHAYGQYCINDVELTYLLFQIFKSDLPVQELKIIDLMLRMFTKPTLTLDKPLLEEHLEEVQGKKEALMLLVEQQCGKDDLMSNQKFAEVLRRLGVEPPMKMSLRTQKETYAFGKGDAEFKRLLEHEDERVQAVVSARLGMKSTLEETRTQAFISIADRGPLPILLNYYGAHTGRASGGDKINLQNLPRGGALRKAIRAKDGHMLVACDSSQIEARVVAWLAGQDDLVEDFANGEDIYSKFATMVYGYPVSKANKVERHLGKTCILGLGYGMGKVKFRDTLRAGNPTVIIDEAEAERIVSLYRNTYPYIRKLWNLGGNALPAIVAGQRYTFGRNQLLSTTDTGILLPNGMQVRYPSLMSVNGEYVYARDPREAKNLAIMRQANMLDANKLNRIYAGKVIENVVQALARIVVFDQMVEINRKYPVVLTVHDEVVCSVPEEEAAEAKAFMEAEMSKAPDWAEGLPVACEAKAGKTYGDAK